MKPTGIDARDERMLLLLSQGGSARDLAKKLGYQEGTMRVYLHNLYRKLGVSNKTEAVIWYLTRAQSSAARVPQPAAATAPPAGATPAPASSGDLFGDMALHDGLYVALGVMSAFIGPYGRLWEVATRLREGEPDAEAMARRERARPLWNALLRGDHALAKRAFDADQGAALALEAPSDAAMLVVLLALGGYSSAAGRLQAQLVQKRRAAGANAREAALMQAMREAVEGDAAAGLDALHQLASEKSAAGVRQVALVALFHAYVAHRDFERARRTANAVWFEAESARQQLQAMGDRSLSLPASAPAPAKQAVRRPARIREKVAAGR